MSLPRSHATVAAVAMCLLAVAAPRPTLAAVDVGGVRFEARVDTPGTALELAGAALYRYAAMFRVYAAGLYLPRGESPLRVLADDVGRRLEIEYLRAIDRDDLDRAGRGLLARNVGPAALEALEPRVAAFHDLYRDVEPGDRYALTYLPGVGTILELNGTELGRVAGPDFARAYFAIWLGDEPLDRRLKTELLGTAAGAPGTTTDGRR